LLSFTWNVISAEFFKDDFDNIIGLFVSSLDDFIQMILSSYLSINNQHDEMKMNEDEWRWMKINENEWKSYIFNYIENRLVKSESIFLFKEITQIKMS
jgi:hypothetical protein